MYMAWYNILLQHTSPYIYSHKINLYMFYGKALCQLDRETCDNIVEFLAQHYRAFSVQLFKGNTFFFCNDSLMKYNEPIYVCLFQNQFWLN